MDTLIIAHSLILGFVSLLGACFYSRFGKLVWSQFYFCDVELVCVDTLIRAHSLILWFVSLLGACLYGSAGEQMGLLSQFCEIYFACGDVSIEALVCWLGCFTRRRCNIHL